MPYRKLAIVGIISVGLLSGCFAENTEENLFVAFENVAKQEKSLFEDTKRLETLEKQEQELYAQIITEGKENNETVAEKIDRAVSNVDKREKILKDEKETLEKAQKKTKLVQSNIGKIDDKRIQKQAEKVAEAYKNRYNAFLEMNDVYVKLMASQKDLYAKLKVKETKLKGISKKVKEVNKLTEEMNKEKEKFNRYTKEYNEEKLALYKKTNIKIKEQNKV
ncbi:YkyA family protein [Bacillus cereus group sp. BfR-BA-01524]|uniref:YkyA family protein n=1 Tax=Bacillus cereus group sp. BfR-BA-01524 TaxID=2920372 RepID=UPI001F5A2D97